MINDIKTKLTQLYYIGDRLETKLTNVEYLNCNYCVDNKSEWF